MDSSNSDSATDAKDDLPDTSSKALPKATWGSLRAVSGGHDGIIKYWHLATGACERNYEGHRGPVRCVKIFSNGLEEWNGLHVISCGADHTVKVWDLRKHECVRSYVGHSDIVTSVVVLPDGLRAVSSSWDGTLKLWDLLETEEDEGCRRTYKDGHSVDSDRRGFIMSVALVPEGGNITEECFLSGGWDGRIVLWDLKSGRIIKKFDGHDGYACLCVKSMLDAKTCASSGMDKKIKIWNIEHGNCVLTLEGHTGPVHSISLSQDGKLLLSGGQDPLLRIWSLDPSDFDTMGREIASYRKHRDWVRTVHFNSDGRILSGSDDGVLKFWDPKDEEKPGMSLRTLGSAKIRNGHKGFVLCSDMLIDSTANKVPVATAKEGENEGAKSEDGGQIESGDEDEVSDQSSDGGSTRPSTSASASNE